MRTKILIIDGNHLARRGFHALKASKGGLVESSEGLPITVCTTFIQSLKRLLKEYTPTHLAVCFDTGKTWRHEVYPAYKSKRKQDSDRDLFNQDLRFLQSILIELKIAVLTHPGYEADDLIASVCKQFSSQINEKVILSGDKDLLQVVNDSQRVILVAERPKESKIYNESLVIEEFGVPPRKIADWKAIVGDESDTIPGIKMLGSVAATKLLEIYQDTEEILADLDNVRSMFRSKIIDNEEKLRLFKKIITLVDDLNLDCDLDKLSLQNLQEESETADELELAIALDYKIAR